MYSVFITRLYALNMYNIRKLCLFIEKTIRFVQNAALVQPTSFCVYIFIYSYYPEMAALAIFSLRLKSEYVGDYHSQVSVSHRRLKNFAPLGI